MMGWGEMKTEWDTRGRNGEGGMCPCEFLQDNFKRELITITYIGILRRHSELHPDYSWPTAGVHG